MMHGLSRPRENICISFGQPYPEVEVRPYTPSTPDDGILVRTLFSLAGTLREESWLRQLPDLVGLPLHPGYASVGVVEEVGPRCTRFNCGDSVMMPVSNCSYITFGGATMSGYTRLLLQHIPLAVDRSDATFAPIVSLALYLVQQVAGRDCVALLGCGLLGTVLLRLLQLENIQAVVCVNAEEGLPHEPILESSAKQVLSNRQSLPQSLLGKVSVAFVLSSADWCDAWVRALLAPQGRCISAATPLDSGEGCCAAPWLTRDMVQEALGLLRDEVVKVKDLVVQHVHAEAVTEVYHAILHHRYRGRALIYDW